MGLYLLSRGPHCESPWTNGQITSGQWRRGSKGTRSYRGRRSKGTTLPSSHPPPPLFRFPPLSPLLFYGRHPTPVVDVAAIRQKSGFAVTRPRRNFPRIAHTSHPFRAPRRSSSRFLSLSEIFDGKIWPFVCAFVSLASQAGEGDWRSIENWMTLTYNTERCKICHCYMWI